MKTLTSTKKIIQLSMIAILSVGLLACQKDDDKTAIGTSGGRGNRTLGEGRQTTEPGGVNRSSSVGFTGVVWAGSGVSQNEFQYRVDNFMSTSFDPLDEIGLINGAANSETGIRMMATTLLELSDGQPIQANSSGNLRTNTGNLKLLIWDEYAVEDGYAYQPAFEMISGTISNNEVRISLRDQHGRIEITGWYDQSHFFGYIDYMNDYFWDGEAPGAQNRLGEFYIPVCDYFRCN